MEGKVKVKTGFELKWKLDIGKNERKKDNQRLSAPYSISQNEQ